MAKNKDGAENKGKRFEGEARVSSVDAAYENLQPSLDKIISDLDLAPWLSGLKGKKVFIKPNMLGVFEPERHATTHPSLVSAAVKLFREAGAEIAVGDNCGVGSYGVSVRAAKASGIMEAADGAFVNVGRETVQVPFKSRFMDTHVVSKAMMEADVLVSLPKMKTHSLTLATGAVKNMFGLVAGAGKGRSHAAAPGLKDFGEILADIYAIRPPDLTIMDSVTAMEGDGPSAGKPVEVGKLLAGKNAVAVDAVMCRMMGLPAVEVHHLRVANRRGLGPVWIEDVDLKGEAPEGRFDLPVNIHRLSMVGRFINRRFFQPIAKTQLILDRKKCVKCKICVEACPSGAMGFEEYPRIDDKVCIRCFCCQELCPESAWSSAGLLGGYIYAMRMGRWRKK